MKYGKLAMVAAAMFAVAVPVRAEETVAGDMGPAFSIKAQSPNINRIIDTLEGMWKNGRKPGMDEILTLRQGWGFTKETEAKYFQVPGMEYGQQACTIEKIQGDEAWINSYPSTGPLFPAPPKVYMLSYGVLTEDGYMAVEKNGDPKTLSLADGSGAYTNKFRMSQDGKYLIVKWRGVDTAKGVHTAMYYFEVVSPEGK